MGKFPAIGLTLVLLILAGNLQAQDQKIGYVNTDYLLSQMPEYEGIQQQLQIIGEQWKEQLEEMQAEIDRLEEEFEAREILYSDSERNERREEIRYLREQREQYLEERFGPEGQYFQRQQELLQPIQKRVFDAIQRVADQQEFDFIFDRAQNRTMLFGRDEWNIDDAVLGQLGIIPDSPDN